MWERLESVEWTYRLALFGYLAGSPLCALAIWMRPARGISTALLLSAWFFNTLWIITRWIEGGRAPFKTLYETLVFLPWCIMGVYFVMAALHRWRVLGPFAAAGSALALIYGLVRQDVEIVYLPPALRSGWFVPHVVVYFVAYAALFAAAVAALLCIVRRKEEYAETAHQITKFGFTALTFGLVLGAIWAKFAWGDYWSWDPKETWALVTWLVYLAYLHLRLVRGWQGPRSAIFLFIGFVVVVFTYLGMNLLPTAPGSLHVYQ